MNEVTTTPDATVVPAEPVAMPGDTVPASDMPATE